MMVLYTALHVEKDVVRGSNAWCNMIQVGATSVAI